MSGTRYKYLDLLKFLAIFYVCIYHFWHGSYQETLGFAEILRGFLYPILGTCVPLFFAVNGALLLNRQTFDGKKHYKNLFTILLQYYIWYAFTSLLLGIHAGLDFSSMHKHELINAFVFLMPLEGVDVTHSWFIPSLCCIYLLYPFYRAVFCQEHTDRSARMALIVLAIFVYIYNFLIHDFNIFKVLSPYLKKLDMYHLYNFHPLGGYTGTMSIYFLMGGFLHKYRQKTDRLPVAVSAVLILAGLALSCSTMYLKAMQGEGDYDIVFNGYNSTGTFLCTAGCFLLASKAESRIPECGAPAFALRIVGSNTMTIYYTHWILGRLVFSSLPIGYGFFWNLLHAGLLVASGTLLGEGMKRIPILKHLVHGS